MIQKVRVTNSVVSRDKSRVKTGVVVPTSIRTTPYRTQFVPNHGLELGHSEVKLRSTDSATSDFFQFPYSSGT